MDEKPTRCIDPVMKFCQECKYGYTHYPEWVETYEDTFDCNFESGCMYGLEDTEPTEEEQKEFDNWVNKTYQNDMRELREEYDKLNDAFTEYRDLVGNIVKTQTDIRNDAYDKFMDELKEYKKHIEGEFIPWNLIESVNKRLKEKNNYDN